MYNLFEIFIYLYTLSNIDSFMTGLKSPDGWVKTDPSIPYERSHI